MREPAGVLDKRLGGGINHAEQPVVAAVPVHKVAGDHAAGGRPFVGRQADGGAHEEHLAHHAAVPAAGQLLVNRQRQGVAQSEVPTQAEAGAAAAQLGLANTTHGTEKGRLVAQGRREGGGLTSRHEKMRRAPMEKPTSRTGREAGAVDTSRCNATHTPHSRPIRWPALLHANIQPLCNHGLYKV